MRNGILVMGLVLASAAATLLASPRSAIADGSGVYASRCSSCHGADGHGDTPVGRALGIRTFEGRHFSAESLEKILRDSGNHTTLDWSAIEPDLATLVDTLNTLAETTD